MSHKPKRKSDPLPKIGHAATQEPLAEQVVVGSLIIEPSLIPDAVDMLGTDGEPLASELLRRLYRIILALDASSEVIEPTSILRAMRDDELLGKVDGAQFIATTMSHVLVPEAIWANLKTVVAAWRLRRLTQAAQEILTDVEEKELPAPEILAKAEKAIFAITGESSKAGTKTVHTLVTEEVAKLEDRQKTGKSAVGIATGFYDLDVMISGLNKTDLIVVAGRPSQGKTSVCMNIAEHVAVKLQLPVAVFSLEMGGSQLVQRLLASISRVPLQRIRSGRPTIEDVAIVKSHAKDLASAPLFIDDMAGVTLLGLSGKARRYATQAGGELGLIVVDYLQLMSGAGTRGDNRQQEIGEISRGMKLLAKELNVPILLLSQLSRESEKRTDKRPILSDLRDSGAIEQDADTVIFVHREGYYAPKPKPGEKVPVTDKTELIVAKQRNGPVGTVELLFHRETARFLSAARP